jgi:streptogramin lyase
MGVALFGPGALLAGAAFADITEYTPPTPGGTFRSGPVDIITGPDGNLWFTERSGRAIGRITPSGDITEFLLPTSNAIPDGITVGPDGWIWFTESQSSTGRLGRLDPLAPDPGSTVEEPVLMNPTNAGPTYIVTGPDGNLWFTERRANRIGRYNPVTQQLAEFPVPGSNPRPIGITVGPDLNSIWFTEQFRTRIGRITLDGVITDFLVPTAASNPSYIVAGPDGNLWFTEYGCDSDAGSDRKDCHPGSPPEPGNRIASFDPITETFTEFPVPTNNSKPSGLVFDADGTLWFTEQAGNKVASLDTLSGVVTEYAMGISLNSLPTAITVGPDCNVWFTEFFGEQDGAALGGKIAKFDLAPIVCV